MYGSNFPVQQQRESKPAFAARLAAWSNALPYNNMKEEPAPGSLGHALLAKLDGKKRTRPLLESPYVKFFCAIEADGEVR